VRWSAAWKAAGATGVRRHHRRRDLRKPEILTALRAAIANHMQPVINIALGASLSTVILTVPAVEALALYNGQPFQMAMSPVQTVMMLMTLLVSAINLNDGETNAIEGMTHFVLFLTFIMLSILGFCSASGWAAAQTARFSS